MSQATEFSLVQKTEFEEICDQIERTNAVRDRHILILEEIMYAYSFIRCVLKANHIAITSKMLGLIHKKLIHKNMKGRFHESTQTWCDGKEENSRQTYFKALLAFEFVSKKGHGSDYLGEIIGSAYRSDIRKNTLPFTRTSLQENLWDPENQRINPNKLVEYARKYHWAFPPNTQELLDERLKEEKEKE